MSAELANRKAAEAEREAEEKERLLYFSDMRLAVDSLQETGGVGATRNLVDKWKPDRSDHRGWEWYWLKAATSSEYRVIDGSGFTDVVFSPRQYHACVR